MLAREGQFSFQVPNRCPGIDAVCPSPVVKNRENREAAIHFAFDPVHKRAQGKGRIRRDFPLLPDYVIAGTKLRIREYLVSSIEREEFFDISGRAIVRVKSRRP